MALDKLNPFRNITSYQDMVSKIAYWTTLYTIMCLIIYAWLVNPDTILNTGINIELFSEISISLQMFAIALLAGGLFRVLKMHDRISDLFKIRRKFDIVYIINKLSAKCRGRELNAKEINILKDYRIRRRVMHDIFYQYASGNPKETVIDYHYVELALNQWCDYWIMVEASIIFIIFSIIAIINSSYYSFIYISMLVVFIIINLLTHKTRVKYADDQIEIITKVDERCNEIRSVLNDI